MSTPAPQFLNLEFLFYKIFLFFQALGILDISGDKVIFTGWQYVFYFKIFLIIVSLFCTFLIIDFLYRTIILGKEKRAWELEQILKNISNKVESKHSHWLEVEQLLDSDNNSDWKLAILEADKILEELLIVLGYQGDSLGDRLMSVEKGDMLALDDAWEAHKYRNRIAHEAGIQMTDREARRIVGLYKKVFQEYKFI